MKFKNLNKALALTAVLAVGSYGGQAAASTITGGDAADQASADAILDIVFTIDTSGSMYDDLNAIAAVAESVVQNLECADTDVWVRARFMGIGGNYGTFWNENVRSVLLSNGRTPITNSTEDNGPVVSDIVANSDLFFNNDSSADQDYYQAIVTIGDEGTENGYPVNQADVNVAYQANQDAINSNTLLFAWVVDDPYTNVPALFEAMAEGGVPALTGTLTVPTFGDTNGAFIEMGSGDSAALSSTLEEVICQAATGGGDGGNGCPPTHSVPEPSSIALLGMGLASLGFSLRRRQRRQKN